VAWLWLVRWRTGRHRAAVWKSLVLPAGGVALCWLLVMTLWLPVLDYARSYAPLVRTISRSIAPGACVEVVGLSRPQAAALRFHGDLDLRQAGPAPACPWLVVAAEYQQVAAMALDMKRWELATEVGRINDPRDHFLLYRRKRR
jgi:hypothetical protein